MQDFKHKILNALCGRGMNSQEKTWLFFLNAYLLSYVAFAAFDIICILFNLGFIGGFLSFCVTAYSFLIFISFLVPGTPKRFFIAPLIYIPAASLLFLPAILLSGMNQRVIDLFFSGIQLLIGGSTMLWIRTSRGAWLLQAKDLKTASFSGIYLLRLFAGSALITIIFFGVSFSALAIGVTHCSSGFIRIEPTSIQFAMKTFKKENKQIILCGMSHIADKKFYDNIKKRFPFDGTIILSEGVSDENGLIKKKSSYKGMSALLNIGVQPSRLSTDISHKNADLDISDFSPETIDILRKTMSVHALLDKKLNKDMTALKKAAFLVKAYKDLSENLSGYSTASLRCVMNDLVQKRNRFLLNEISSALDDHETVIIPWGVWHMPELERMIKENGFICQEKIYFSLF